MWLHQEQIFGTVKTMMDLYDKLSDPCAHAYNLRCNGGVCDYIFWIVGKL